MGDTGDDYRAWKDHKREQKRKYGVECPGCMAKFPKAPPKKLMPGEKCFCGYRDPRKRSNEK